MMICYVCLEPCQDSSPCECLAPIHESCLRKMQQKMPHVECTICHRPFSDAVNVHEDPPVQDCPEVGCNIIVLFTWYLIAGWLGKSIVFLAGFDIKNYLFFWTMGHALSAFGTTTVFCLCSFPFLQRQERYDAL